MELSQIFRADSYFVFSWKKERNWNWLQNIGTNTCRNILTELAGSANVEDSHNPEAPQGADNRPW